MALGIGASASHGGVMLQYKFNEGSGSTVYDTGTGSAANATLGSGAVWIADAPGAYAFSASTANMTTGSGSYLALSNSNLSKLNNLPAFTVTVWTKLAEIPVQYDRIYGSGNSGVLNANFDFFFQGPAAAANAIDLKPGAIASTNASLTVGEWVFYAATYKANTPINGRNYYRGTQDDPVVGIGTSTTSDVTTTTGIFNALEIAGHPTSTSDRTPKAYFSDFRVYDEVLGSTALEAVRLTAVPEPATLAWLGLGGLAALVRRRRVA